jgi:hypothetical protein
MRRKIIITLTFVFAAAFTAVFLPVPGSQAQTQRGCKMLYGIVQGSLPTPNQFAPTDTWGGPVYASLAGESLFGGISGNDGTQLGQGAVSVLKDGVYKICFSASGAAWGGPNDCLDSFTYEVPHAVVIWPAANWLGSYKATANIVNGTNRFASASGHLDVVGPFVLWTDPKSPFGVSGRWNGEFSGNICGVQ